MSRNIQLLKNTLIILFGKVCTQLISYALLPMYTTYLSTEEYGTVDLLITYITLVAPVITLQIESALFRYLIDTRENKDGIDEIITNSIVTAMITSLIFVLIFLFFTSVIDFKYKLLFLFGVIASAILSIMLQIARGIGDNLSYAISSSISGIMSVALNIFFIMYLNMGVSGMLLATIISQILGSIYILIKNKVYSNLKINYINKKTIKKLLSYSLPLVPNGLSWWIISVSDRTIVSIFLGTAANGILAVANKFSTIVVNVFAIFNLSWTESVSIHINDEDSDKYISNMTNLVFNFFAFAGAMLVLLISLFFNFLIGSNFSAAYMYVPLLIFSSILNIAQTLYGIIYIGKKETKKISSSVMVAGIINLIIDLLLIRFIGIFASPVSTIASMIYLLIYRYKDINRNMDIKFKKKDILIIFIVFIFSNIVYFLRNDVITIFALVIVSVYFLIFNRSMVKIILNKVKRRKEYR